MAGRRHGGVSGAAGLPGEDPRLPHRARRDRDDAAPASVGARLRRGCAHRRGRRAAAGGVSRRRGRTAGCVGAARTPPRDAARAHGAWCVRRAGHAATVEQRQGGSSRAARSAARPCGALTRARSAAVGSGARAGRDLVARAARRAGRRDGRLLRAGRRFAVEHPDRVAGGARRPAAHADAGAAAADDRGTGRPRDHDA